MLEIYFPVITPFLLQPQQNIEEEEEEKLLMKTPPHNFGEEEKESLMKDSHENNKNVNYGIDLNMPPQE